MAQFEWSEIFLSLEGEAAYTGWPTIYIRFARCNFQCKGFNNPDNLDTTKVDVIGFDPKDYLDIKDLPLITRGCDSIYSWDKKFAHLWEKGDETKLAIATVELLPFHRWSHPESNLPVILSLSVDENEPVLATQNTKWQYKPIKDYWNNALPTHNELNVEWQEPVDLLCHTFDNGTVALQKVSKIFRHKEEDLLEITTRFNYSIKITKSHSLMVLGENGNIQERAGNQLSWGDYLLVPKHIPIFEEETTIDLVNYIGVNYRGKWKIYDDKIVSSVGESEFNRFIKVDDNLSELIGYYVSEGTFYEVGTATFCLGDEQHLAQRIVKLIQLTFNCKATVVFTPLKEMLKHHSNATKDSYKVQIHNKVIGSFLSNVCGIGSLNKKVPDFILTASNKAKAHFIMANVEGDGHVQANHTISGTQFGVTTSSKLLSDGILIIGRMLGLKGRIEKFFDDQYQHWRYNSVFAGNENIKTLQQHLKGFIFSKASQLQLTGTDKQTKREVYFSGIPFSFLLGKEKTADNRKKTKREKIVKLLDRIKTARGARQSVYKRYGYLNKDGNITQKTVRLENVLKTTEEWNLVEIQSIVPIRSAGYVYDFEVPENHTFVAGTGPILSHNTGGEPTLRARTIPTLINHPLFNDMRYLLFETNCAVPLTMGFIIELDNWLKADKRRKIIWSNSPKLSVSGESWDKAIKPEIAMMQRNLINGGYEQYFKFVCDANQRDFDEVGKAMHEYHAAGIPKDVRVYIMPVACTAEQQEEIATQVADMCKERGYIFCLRLQNVLWKNQVGT